jgi:hypothetical protein
LPNHGERKGFNHRWTRIDADVFDAETPRPQTGRARLLSSPDLRPWFMQRQGAETPRRGQAAITRKIIIRRQAAISGVKRRQAEDWAWRSRRQPVGSGDRWLEPVEAWLPASDFLPPWRGDWMFDPAIFADRKQSIMLRKKLMWVYPGLSGCKRFYPGWWGGFPRARRVFAVRWGGPRRVYPWPTRISRMDAKGNGGGPKKKF